MAYAMVGAQARPKKEYIATAAFNNAFFTYTAIAPSGTTLANTGKMTLVTGATAANCPAGRILRELGAHLYPGANPGLLPTDANYNVFATHGSHIFTKVYDAVTGLRGFIDANDKVFATYSNERPEEFVDVGEIDGTGRRGPSIYTNGNLTVGGTGRLTVGTSIAGQTALVAGTRAVTIAGLTTASIAFVTIATPNTGTLSVKYQATCTADTLTITALIAAGTINIADISTVNYFVVN